MKYLISLIVLLQIGALTGMLITPPQEEEMLQAAPGLWYPSGNEAVLAIDDISLKVPFLTNCELITTNGTGVFSCGTAGAGSQTPLTSNIDGAGYDFSNLGTITGENYVSTSTTANVFPNASSTNLSVSGNTNLSTLSLSGLLTGTTASLSNLTVSGTATTTALCFASGQCMTQPSINGSNVTMYHWTGDADIAGYEMFRTFPDNAVQTDDTCTATGGYCASPIDSYISTTSDLSVASISAGTWNFHYWAYVGSTAGVSKLQADVYRRTSGGTETLLFTATSSEINTTSIAETDFSSAQGAFAFDVTDRLVVKVLGHTTSAGAIDIHFVYGGTSNYSHVETPIMTADFDYAVKSANETITGNWNFTGLTTHARATSTLISGTSAWYTNFYGALSGNASTATALGANGANCSAGSFPLGVDASGAVESCTDAWTEAENTSAGYQTVAQVYSIVGATTSLPNLATLAGLTSLGTNGATTTAQGVLQVGSGDTGKLSLGTYGQVEAKLNSDTEKSISITSSQSVDIQLGASGYFNVYNSLGSSIFYVQNSDSRIQASGSIFTSGTLNAGSVIASSTLKDVTATAFGIVGKFFASATQFVVAVVANFTAGLTVLDFLDIPSSTNPTVDAEGELAVNTTQASSSLRFHDGTAERSASDRYQKTLKISSSTILSLNGVNTGTTTIVLDKAILSPITHLTRYCETNTGNWSYRIGDGTSSSTVQTCTTTGANATITNGTFEFGDKIYLEIGSSTGSTVGTLIIGQRYDAD